MGDGDVPAGALAVPVTAEWAEVAGAVAGAGADGLVGVGTDDSVLLGGGGA